MDLTVSAQSAEPVAPAAPRRPEPNTLVIFGASGDLTHRKLIPALYRLSQEGLLPDGYAVLGYARRPYGDAEFRDELKKSTAEHAAVDAGAWERFAANVYYCQGEFADAGGYERLKGMLEKVDAEHHTGGRHLFYLATPPSAYTTIVDQLGRAGLSGHAGAEGQPWTRIIIEKPFGRDLKSACDLNHEVLSVFDERQVYRIDHYLGKETTQNIMAFRFGNSVLEPVWNRRYVDHVEIAVAEDIGVEGRGAYYDTAGALRDIVQNHMMQLLTLVSMEPPSIYDADAVRDEKVKVLRAVHPMTAEEVRRDTVRAQYTSGHHDGTRMPGYCDEPGVAQGSQTETYVAMRMHVDNWRWAGVPFYLRSGKALAKRVTEVTVQFRHPPLMLFPQLPQDTTFQAHAPEPNVLRLRIQPDEGISLRFGLKVPGPNIVLEPVTMDFSYKQAFGVEPPEAYQRLLHDAMLGDRTLFIRRDEVEAAWALMDPILQEWSQDGPALGWYEAGSWGPPEADALMRRDDREWTAL